MAAVENTAAEIARQVRALGAKFDADVLAATRAIYRPHLDLSEVALHGRHGERGSVPSEIALAHHFRVRKAMLEGQV